MKPNKVVIQQHLEFLFKDTPVEYADGLIEIAYSDANSGAVRRANLFPLDKLDEAVQKAYDENSKEGINVYVGAALREPSTCPVGRTNAEDYYASTCVWVDIDDPEASDNAPSLYVQLPPSCIVVTGRHPHRRFQAWWKIQEPQDNPTELRRSLAGLQSALHGDAAVVDPARIMRIGGSVAWPKKTGRVTELTEVARPSNFTPVCSLDALHEAYEPVEFKSKSINSVKSELYNKPQNDPKISDEQILEMLSFIDPDEDYGKWVRVGMALHAGGYDFNIFDTWSAKGKKYKDSECWDKWGTFKGDEVSIGTLVHMAKDGGYVYAPKNTKNVQNPSRKKLCIDNFDHAFESIIPFDQHHVPQIPADILPDTIKCFVEDIAHVLSVPTAMPVMAALGIVSTAVSKKFVISPKSDWLEPINIYTLTTMPPASNKSQVLKLLKDPIDEWEAMQTEKLKPELHKAESVIKITEMELKKQRRIITANTSTEEDLKAAKDNVFKLEETLRDQIANKPFIPQIYTTDATPEALARLVYEQKNRLAIISDEGGIMEVLSGLYNKGNANVDIFLKGIDGGSLRIKRESKDYQLTPYLTLLLLVQPQVLIDISQKQSFTGNGALERFLFTVPEGNVGYRTFDNAATINGFDKDRYDNLIKNLLHLPVDEKPKILELNHPAKTLFDEFRQEIENKLRPDGKLYFCRAWGGKLAGYTLRLAGLIHVAEYESGQNLMIEEQTMQSAIKLARLLIEHAIAAFVEMGADESLKDAKDVYEVIKAKEWEEFTKSDILQVVRNRKCGKKKRLDPALNTLADRNIISEAHYDYSTRKPKEMYFVNPDIFI